MSEPRGLDGAGYLRALYELLSRSGYVTSGPLPGELGAAPEPDESQRLAELLADADPGNIAAMGYDPASPRERQQAIAIMRKYIDMGRRCPGCGALNCRGVDALELCELWQQAERRADRGEPVDQAAALEPPEAPGPEPGPDAATWRAGP